MLVDDITAIKTIQEEQKKSQQARDTAQGNRDVTYGKFEQKMLDYMEQGKIEHDLIFKKNRDQDKAIKHMVTWPTVYKVIGVTIAIGMFVIAIITVVRG